MYLHFINHTPMKKILRLACLLFVALSFTYSSFAQGLSARDFVGYWKSDGTTTRIIFFKDRDHNLQMVEWDTQTGEEMKITKFKVDGDELVTKEVFQSANHSTNNRYILMDENRIKNIITGGADATIYFDRIK